MSLFRFGSSEDVSISSIVVFARPFTECDWQLLELTMKSFFTDQIPKGRDLGIEFLFGKFSTDLDHSFVLNPSMPSEMGSSNEVEEKKGSFRTISNFVHLKMDSKMHFGILTQIITPWR